jgi:hypothetical protein
MLVYAHKVRVISAIGRRHVVLPWGGHMEVPAAPTRQLTELWVLLAELRNNCWVGGAEHPQGGELHRRFVECPSAYAL